LNIGLVLASPGANLSPTNKQKRGALSRKKPPRNRHHASSPISKFRYNLSGHCTNWLPLRGRRAAWWHHLPTAFLLRVCSDFKNKMCSSIFESTRLMILKVLSFAWP
jgi:hypothetical protein